MELSFINITLILWIISTVFIVLETRMVRMVIWFGIYSLIGSLGFLLLGSPDVAMAEAAIGGFSTIFFIVCFERYFGLRNVPEMLKADDAAKKESVFKRTILPLGLTTGLFGLFVYFTPDSYYNPYLKELYLERFTTDVGGQNAVTSIYLGYRVYDTLFEALMLVVAVVAVIHLSEFSETSVKDGKHSEVERDGMAIFFLKLMSPLIILFGLYLVVNGFVTAGGGFQGGLAIAAFFVVRYLIFDIYDVPIEKVAKLEEVVFAAITIMAALVIFQEAFYGLAGHENMELFQNVYLIAMNGLIGAKVACGFTILFYRYIAIERK